MLVSDTQRVVLNQKNGIYYNESNPLPALSKRNYPSISPPKKRAVNNYVPGLKLANSSQIATPNERIGIRTTSTRAVKDSNPHRSEYEKLNVTESYINHVEYTSGYSTLKNSQEYREGHKIPISKLNSNYISASLGPKLQNSSTTRQDQKQCPAKILPTKALPLDYDAILQGKVKLERIDPVKRLSQRESMEDVPETRSRAFLRVKSFTAENSPEKIKKDINKMSSPYLNMNAITKNNTVGEEPTERGRGKKKKGDNSFYDNDKNLKFDRSPGVSVIESCMRVLDFCNPSIMDVLSKKPKKQESRSNSIEDQPPSQLRANSKAPRVRIKLAPVYDCKLGKMIAYNEDYHNYASPKHINFAKATATVEDSKLPVIESRFTEHFPAIQKAARSIEKDRIRKLLM